MQINGPATKAFESAAVFHNRGTIHWSGSGEIWSDGRENYGYAPITFNNESGGIFSAESDTALTTWGSSHTFNNLAGAVFRKTGAFGTTSTAWNLNNFGTLDLQAGTVAINAGYSTAPSAQLKIPLGGVNPGTQFGSESFAPPAVFDGTFAVTLTNGFTPTNGQSFALANCPSYSGQFASTQLLPLPVVSRWQLTYNPTSLVLEVVPASAFQSASLAGNGNFQFQFQGQTGSSCLIEVSTNLSAWLPLVTNAPFNGSFIFTDPNTSQVSKRFYRATIFP